MAPVHRFGPLTAVITHFSRKRRGYGNATMLTSDDAKSHKADQTPTWGSVQRLDKVLVTCISMFLGSLVAFASSNLRLRSIFCFFFSYKSERLFLTN